MDDNITRITKAKKAFVSTPDVAAIINNIDRCRRLSKFGAEPSCMMVYGASGVGKTSIIRKYLKANDKDSTARQDIVPVVYIELPENAKPVDAARELLLYLEDPLALYESDLAILTKRIVDLVPTMKIELIIIDEFQHLVEKSSNRILSRVGDWLKMLINKTKCPVILFGMPYSKVVLAANSQLRSRFSIQFELKPFSYINNYGIYAGFLRRLDEALPFDQLSNLASEPIAKKIYAFSQGNMRSLRNLVFHAAVNAIENDNNCISKNDWEFASNLTSGNKLSTWKNPFVQGVKITDRMLQDQPNDLGWEDYMRNNRGKRKPFDESKIFS